MPGVRHLKRYSTCAAGKWCSTTCIIVNLYRSVSSSDSMIMRGFASGGKAAMVPAVGEGIHFRRTAAAIRTDKANDRSARGGNRGPGPLSSIRSPLRQGSMLVNCVAYQEGKKLADIPKEAI